MPSTSVFQYQAGLAPGRRPALDLSTMQTILERRTGRSDIRLREPRWSSLWRANIRLPARRDVDTTQLSIGYRGSALARDDRDAPALLRAGDRAPDATGLTTVPTTSPTPKAVLPAPMAQPDARWC